jgi:hypothetical protein
MKSSTELISFGSLLALAGFVLSGPVGFLIVNIFKPQPSWVSAEVFVSNYSPVQNIPYFFGFILVGGMLILAAGHYINAEEAKGFDKLHIMLALAWTTIFATLAFFNYICQTTFIHHLARHYRAGYATSIETFSMANPGSLSWSIEMWSYSFLGVATWLMSAFYKEKNRGIYIMLILNGIVSIVSAVLFTIDDSWILTPTGLIGYFFWNLLMIALLVLIYVHSKNASRKTSPQGSYRAAASQI